VGGLALSVLTVSTGRPQVLLAKLAALAEQSVAPASLEVVLVDNACPERVGRRAAARSWPFALRVVRCERRASAGRARCLAAAQARAPLVWLSDDDCVPARDAVERHLARHRDDRTVAIGSVRYLGGATAHVWTPRRVGPLQLTGANATLPRDAMLAACAHPVELPRAYGGEDGALGLQLQRAGLRFVAAPEASVDHHGPDPMHGADASKAFDAGYNAVAIARRWPEAAWSLGVHPFQVALKRLVLAAPEGRAWRRLAPGRARYERAYLDGSLAARRDLASEAEP
jgi:hypothetical protein